MTELLYLLDSYAKEFEAKILAIEGNKVELDKTGFYPQGGGQPSDSGILEYNGKKWNVLEVKKESEKVWHKLSDIEGLKVGMNVKGILDWERRYHFMRMHTSAHVLAAVIFRETGKLITGNQLGWPQSRMDFNVEEYDAEWLKQLQETANDVLAAPLRIAISSMPREEALKNPELVRLKDVMPPALEEWRIVSIGDYDVQADGGTHVKSTDEVGKIEIVKTENKGADNRRIYWELH